MSDSSEPETKQVVQIDDVCKIGADSLSWLESLSHEKYPCFRSHELRNPGFFRHGGGRA